VNKKWETQSHAVFLVGPPGVGKTTWLNDNPSFVDFIVASTDSILEQYADQHGITYRQAFQQHMKEAEKQFKDQICACVESNLNIIFDRTNMSVKSRAKLLNMVPNHYKKTAVVFLAPKHIIEQQLEKREQETGKHVPEAVLETMLANFEFPTTVEGFDHIMTIQK